MDEEKPRSLTFDLNSDASYNTGLVCGGTLEVFVEPVIPPAGLYIFGGGHVALSLCKVACLAGFEVTVIDDRGSYANRERFPEAGQVIAADFEAATATLQPSASSFLVIVTRGHRDDMRVLGWAVKTPARYIGMIGSRRKVLSIYGELEKAGIDRGLFERVHAPIGLEIGAITPEEIAVAIVAEMIAVRRNVTVAGKSKAVQERLNRPAAPDHQEKDPAATNTDETPSLESSPVQPISAAVADVGSAQVCGSIKGGSSP